MTDPTEYFFGGLARAFTQIFQPVEKAINRAVNGIAEDPVGFLVPVLSKDPAAMTTLQIASAVLLGPQAAALVSGSQTWNVTGSLEGGVKAAVINCATSDAFQFVGHHPSVPVLHNGAGNVAAHAVVGCASSVASGGCCNSGAVAGAVGRVISQVTPQIGDPRNSTFDLAANTVTHAVAGGIGAVIAGG